MRTSWAPSHLLLVAIAGYVNGHDVATLVTPDAILRWHRRLLARK
jgi:hypothetical protein